MMEYKRAFAPVMVAVVTAAYLSYSSYYRVAWAGKGPSWHERVLVPVIVSVMSGVIMAEYDANLNAIHRAVGNAVRGSGGWLRATVLEHYIDSDIMAVCGHAGDEDWMWWLWTEENVKAVNLACMGIGDLSSLA